MRPTAILCLLLPLVACDDAILLEPDLADPPCGPGFVLGDDGCSFSEEAIAHVMRTFDGGDLVKVNRVPFEQSMGPSFERNVWVSPLPVELANGDVIDTVELYAMVDPFDRDAALPAAFPVGTVIVHETVNREEGHTVQVKLGADAGSHADENGRDWYFGKYFDDGVRDEVPCTPCSVCHNDSDRPATDGLVGVPDIAM